MTCAKINGYYDMKSNEIQLFDIKTSTNLFVYYSRQFLISSDQLKRIRIAVYIIPPRTDDKNGKKKHANGR